MDKPEGFTSLQDVADAAQADQVVTVDQALAAMQTLFGRHRDTQTVLHFETPTAILGPGRLVGFDVEARTVSIQLLGESDVVELPWSGINDFGKASYNEPRTMGQTLRGAYWEAKVTRRYLERIVANSYARLAPEEVDSFERIAEIQEVEVAELCPLSVTEAEVKQHLHSIIGDPFVQKDWGGEDCDIFCSIQFRRRAVPAAFILKGKSCANRQLSIRDLGKNGDQLVRMFHLQAEVFVVQSNGPVGGAVYSQLQAQVAEKLMTNQPVYYLVLDGVQTARLLRAYGCI